MRHETGTFEAAGGLQLTWQCWRPDGPARAVLAIVHGYGEHSGRYRAYIEHLVPRGYALYGFDLRGHGQSPGARGHVMSWDEFRGDVRLFLRFVREREPDKPLFLLGHSMGGLIVLDFALEHQEDLAGVIASAPALEEMVVSPFRRAVGHALSRVHPTFSLDSPSDGSRLSRDPAVIAAYLNDPLIHGRGSARFATELFRTMAQTRARAAEWSLPLLVLHGTADRIVSFAASRAFFDQTSAPDKEFIAYEGGYHEPHSDVEAARVMQDVEGWLARHLPSAER